MTCAVREAEAVAFMSLFHSTETSCHLAVFVHVSASLTPAEQTDYRFILSHPSFPDYNGIEAACLVGRGQRRGFCDWLNQCLLHP